MRTLPESVLGPLVRHSLARDIVRAIGLSIRAGEYQPGSRLPSILSMARSFRVGHPTVREALRALEALQVVEIRHGSGVYVRVMPASSAGTLPWEGADGV
jgi:GntR family transcriptional regulator, transcriptional repressor for pyruvate dehydrogenase complex